ncbi:B-lymphocyte antigen CD20-like [Elgaria multicarinata webbii]|uniref:B-lymphocyte antigen CD20-like n=1 Tax=Elgaria multicarinata webbii TaxID=159646 RepID=UPI002FCCF58D
MATTVTDCGNVRIITQVIQQTSPQAEATAANVPGSPSMTSQLTPAQIKHFNNTLSKALGVVEIVLGAMQISFGLALTPAQEKFKSITVISGVYFWIGILLLFSGSLLVEMEKRELRWLVKACFFANFVVLIAALVAVILHATDILEDRKESPCTEDTPTYYCNNNDQKLSYGLNSVFIIFSLLEVSIAVTAMVITFKTTRQQLYQQMRW